MRVSSYNIYVELSHSKNYYFIAQGYTGAIDLINKETAHLLKASKDDSLLNQLNPSFKQRLIERGYLTSKSKEEERDYICTLSKRISEKKKSHAFQFVITQDCNFRCPYCFENDLSNKGESWSKLVFTKKLVDDAYKAIELIQPDQNKINKEIHLYGGEPLMKENYNIVKYIVELGIQKGFKFRATTNGYDLDHFMDLLGKDGITKLQITIDGLKETNNTRRIHYQGKDTFSKIIRNISKALSKDVFVYNRINVDKDNIEQVEKLLEHYKSEGFFKHKFQPYAAKVVDVESNCHNNCKNELGYSEFYKQMVAIKNKQPSSAYLDILDFDLRKNLRGKIESDDEFIPKSTYCGANNGMLLFDPSGKIYTCGERIGFENHVVGSFNKKLEINEVALNAWHNRDIGNIKQCSNCKYALWCGGGCAAELKPKDDINLNRSNCQDFPKLFSNIVNDLFKHEFNHILKN